MSLLHAKLWTCYASQLYLALAVNVVGSTSRSRYFMLRVVSAFVRQISDLRRLSMLSDERSIVTTSNHDTRPCRASQKPGSPALRRILVHGFPGIARSSARTPVFPYDLPLSAFSHHSRRHSLATMRLFIELRPTRQRSNSLLLSAIA